MQIEIFRRGGIAMNQKTAATNVVGDRQHSEKDVLQQASAKPPTDVCVMHTEPGQQCHRLRVTASALGQTFGCVGNHQMCHAPPVVGHDGGRVERRNYEHLRRARSVRLTGVVAEPICLFG